MSVINCVVDETNRIFFKIGKYLVSNVQIKGMVNIEIV